MIKSIYIAIVMIASNLVCDGKPSLIFIEGNIGAGKSTFVKILQKHLSPLLSTKLTQEQGVKSSFVISLEPCDEWQNVEGYNLLHAFYADPCRWASLFQIYASMTRVRKQQIESQYATVLHIMERSWFSDRYCFAKMLYENLKINAMEWAVYEQMWDWNAGNLELPLCFIYLQVPAQECYKRLKIRNRNEEVAVSLAYLQDLHEYHERLLIDKTSADCVRHIPVLVLDGSLNFRDDKGVQQIFIRQILDFLKIHGNIDLNI